MELQAGFVGGIVVPLWRALAQSLPALSFAAGDPPSSTPSYILTHWLSPYPPSPSPQVRQ